MCFYCNAKLMNSTDNKTKGTSSAHQKQLLRELLESIPPEVVATFTEKQIAYLEKEYCWRNNGNHKVDMRRSIFIPLVNVRFYFVLLMDKNTRKTLRERGIFASIRYFFALTRPYKKK